MNRLILIGNGFDIAHKIKTSYKDFILDYLKNVFNSARDYEKYEDEFITVIKNNRFDKQLNTNPYISTWELNNFYGYIQSDNSLGITVTGRPIYKETLEYTLKLKNNLISILLSSCRESNWVDIENEYYKILCELSSKSKIQEIIELNKGFELLQNLLFNYLNRIEKQHSSEKYDVSKSYLLSQLTEPIKHNLAPQSKKTVRGININTNNAPTPNNILFLNFNYTSTIETYIKEIRKTIPNTNVIYIHGKLNDINNPMIFGYGDEDETNFELLEKYDECLKYIKTYWYLRTNNYENFLKFIDSDEFEVYVMGHSCGMSDKTMLSSIFNNSNCKKIKILTYDKSFGSRDLTIDTTNYIEMTYQIGRLFNNKADLRKKLISFQTKDLLKIEVRPVSAIDA
ncbi:AbiH family protein [Chryseobacterium takakiae]|uniref:Bacteriophage abortive infection AbiH n=1 Tax=Chryseobacterium takakiae TaxID=1302685 RepID=A0A1M4UKA3_9FLAO|nr:AbiH family protein [Chryseobacterium takakiae]SHE57211.1 Bacteriophage abortive infection AbiH [Chryseobacterium takakiae]